MVLHNAIKIPVPGGLSIVYDVTVARSKHGKIWNKPLDNNQRLLVEWLWWNWINPDAMLKLHVIVKQEWTIFKLPSPLIWDMSERNKGMLNTVKVLHIFSNVCIVFAFLKVVKGRFIALEWILFGVYVTEWWLFILAGHGSFGSSWWLAGCGRCRQTDSSANATACLLLQVCLN